MKMTLRIDTKLYRQAKAAAAQEGITLTKFIEQALQHQLQRVGSNGVKSRRLEKEIAERNRMMDALLGRTAHFRLGPRPSRDEMNSRGHQ